eukprot:CAMPEP_0181293446 /NCGR_PEP_ID=MMETSP1101-20121128/3070_1 /TAXON_ID=46948 /ORGANISM="Rhodomonas abbreviata, Strain Caron Lab Isolate" /LENGTH=608 /DNA_ID=CAMNT_0023398035 /DNA_START=172 /DNA_END=1995 /DNA_ORIENTATION=+
MRRVFCRFQKKLVLVSWVVFVLLQCLHISAVNVDLKPDAGLADTEGGGCTKKGGERVLLAAAAEEEREQTRRALEAQDAYIKRLEARLREVEDVAERLSTLESGLDTQKATTTAIQADVDSVSQKVGQLSLDETELKQNVEIMHSKFTHPIKEGETAFMFMCTIVMLMMTIPGLALFYGGLVRMQNVLSTVMQSFSICCLITVLWLCFGYSLSFGPGNTVIGGTSRFWLQGTQLMQGHPLKESIPEMVFVTYNLMFAVITPALISGAFADRMKFGPMLVFVSLWHLLVYCPLAHSSWTTEGFLHKQGVLDFAGGNVVHVAAGCSGLVSSIVVGKRAGYGHEIFHAHNILLSVLGVSLLWVGWLGFNGGSYPNGKFHTAGMAMLNTQISASVSSLTWMFTEWAIRKRPSVLGIISGAVAGLVTITPGAGYVDMTGAFCFGLLAGPVCYFSAQLKHKFGYDDALDAFGIHGPGGALGGVLTGFFAKADDLAGPPGPNGAFFGNPSLIGLQLYGVVVAGAWSSVVTLILLKLVDRMMGIRVAEDDERNGLDMVCHGETIAPYLNTPGDSEHAGDDHGGQRTRSSWDPQDSIQGMEERRYSEEQGSRGRSCE